MQAAHGAQQLRDQRAFADEMRRTPLQLLAQRRSTDSM